MHGRRNKRRTRTKNFIYIRIKKAPRQSAKRVWGNELATALVILLDTHHDNSSTEAEDSHGEVPEVVCSPFDGHKQLFVVFRIIHRHVEYANYYQKPHKAADKYGYSAVDLIVLPSHLYNSQADCASVYHGCCLADDVAENRQRTGVFSKIQRYVVYKQILNVLKPWKVHDLKDYR